MAMQALRHHRSGGPARASHVPIRLGRCPTGLAQKVPRSVSVHFREQDSPSPATKEAATKQIGAARDGTSKDDPTALDPQNPAEATDYVDWRNAWYAVYPIAELPTDRPRAITILGKDLVVWRNAQGQWSVFEDLCPHRFVPLSEGRIEADGTLSCAYHGWRFNGAGTCTEIPQLPSKSKKTERIVANPLACATAFPTTEGDGLLWVWMNSGPDAFKKAAATPLPLSEGTEGTDYLATTWFVRDVPLSWELLLENSQDTSHVPFSHHGIGGVGGFNRERPTANCYDTFDFRGSRGFTVSESQPQQFGTRWLTSHISTTAPSRFDVVNYGYDKKFEKGNAPPPSEAVGFIARFHGVPVTRTSSRLILRIESIGDNEKAKTVFRNPIWRDHLKRHEIFDGDVVFLHRQGNMMQRGRFKPEQYFTPSKTDLSIVMLWKFMRKHAPEGIDYYPHDAEPVSLPRREVLDRYHSHTEHCSACSAALENTRRARAGAGALIALGLCTGATLLVQGSPVLPMALDAALMAGGAAAFQKLTELEAKFVYKDYVHADK